MPLPQPRPRGDDRAIALLRALQEEYDRGSLESMGDVEYATKAFLSAIGYDGREIKGTDDKLMNSEETIPVMPEEGSVSGK